MICSIPTPGGIAARGFVILYKRAGRKLCFINKKQSTKNELVAMGKKLTYNYKMQKMSFCQEKLLEGSAMKNKTLLLLAIVLVLGVMLAPQVQAAETHAADHCICYGSEHILDHAGCTAVTWSPTTEAYSGSDKIHFTKSGAYYLTGEENRQIVIDSGVEVSLCLNGNPIYADKTISIPENATLNVCDCAGEGKISTTWVSKENEKSRGWAVKVEKGIFNFYSGTISGKGPERGQQARSIYAVNATLRIYGGTITGGYGVASESFSGRGGNVYASGSVVQMLGGTVTGGNAAEHGGNLYLLNSEFRMEKGAITKGNAGTHGGNVCVLNGIMEMGAEAVISGGTSGAKGGNICLIGNDSTTTGKLSGTVTGGACGTFGGNISVNQAGGGGTQLHLLEGCVVSDGTCRAYGEVAGGGGNLHLHGKDSVLYMEGATVTGGRAASKAGGNLYAETGTFELQDGTIADGSAMYHAGNVYVEKAATVTMKGGTVSGGTTTGDGDSSSGGNFYVAGKVTMTGGTVTGGSAYAGGNFQIDEGTVNINGGTVSAGTAKSFGGNVYCCGMLNVRDGVITRGTAGKDGGNLAVSGLYGGEVVGSVTVNGGQITDGTAGAGFRGANLAVINAGAAQVSGGTFSGGKTDAGENDISMIIDGVYRGAPELVLSKTAAARVYLDNTAAYQKGEISYEPKLTLTELEETAEVTLEVAQPKMRVAITADATGKKAVSMANFGYGISMNKETGAVTLKNLLPIWIGAGAAAVLMLAVVLVLVLKKKK